MFTDRPTFAQEKCSLSSLSNSVHAIAASIPYALPGPALYMCTSEPSLEMTAFQAVGQRPLYRYMC